MPIHHNIVCEGGDCSDCTSLAGQRRMSLYIIDAGFSASLPHSRTLAVDANFYLSIDPQLLASVCLILTLIAFVNYSVAEVCYVLELVNKTVLLIKWITHCPHFRANSSPLIAYKQLSPLGVLVKLRLVLLSSRISSRQLGMSKSSCQSRQL